MSKKLIAVAAAAALALTGLVATPAAASASVAYLGAPASAGNTSAAPILVQVPAANQLDFSATDSTTGTAVRFDVTAATTNDAIRVTATGGIKLLTLAQYTTSANRKATFGSQSLELTSGEASPTAGFYAYSTSTQVGTVTVVTGGNTIVRHLKGVSDVNNAYNLNFTAPTTTDVSGVFKVTGNVTDVFGNKIEGITADNFVTGTGSRVTLQVTRFGVTGSNSTGADDVWTESTTEKGTYTFGVDTSATAGAGALGLGIDVAKTEGFADPRKSIFFSFTTASLADQVALLNTQIASMRLKANSVTKKKYNTLARKWNAANPSSKVKLKK